MINIGRPMCSPTEVLKRRSKGSVISATNCVISDLVRVIVDCSFHESSNIWEDNGNLVGDGSNESLGIAAQGVGAEETLEAREEQLVFLAEIYDSLYNGELPCPSGTVEPHNETVCVDLLPDPVHDLVHDGFTAVARIFCMLHKWDVKLQIFAVSMVTLLIKDFVQCKLTCKTRLSLWFCVL